MISVSKREASFFFGNISRQGLKIRQIRDEVASVHVEHFSNSLERMALCRKRDRRTGAVSKDHRHDEIGFCLGRCSWNNCARKRVLQADEMKRKVSPMTQVS